jgi:hypothetical protein
VFTKTGSGLRSQITKLFYFVIFFSFAATPEILNKIFSSEVPHPNLCSLLVFLSFPFHPVPFFVCGE